MVVVNLLNRERLSKTKPRHHYLTTYSDRWTSHARSGKWEKILADKKSYVHRDSSYGSFEKMLAEHIQNTAPKIIVDIGCGNATIREAFKEYHREEEYYGIDIAEGMIEEANRAYPKANFFVSDAIDIIEIFPSFFKPDLVFSRGVIVSHMGRPYFSRILNNIAELEPKDVFFDYLSQPWHKGKKAPSIPRYEVKHMEEMFLNSPFKNNYSMEILDPSRRSPIVHLSKES